MKTIWQVSYTDPWDERGNSKVVAHYAEEKVARQHCEKGNGAEKAEWVISTREGDDSARYGSWTITMITVYETLEEFQAEHRKKVRLSALRKLDTALTAEEREVLGI